LPSARDELNELGEDGLEDEGVLAFEGAEVFGHSVECGVELRASVKFREDFAAIENVLHRCIGLVESAHNGVADAEGGVFADVGASVRGFGEGVEGFDEFVFEGEIGDVPVLGCLTALEGAAFDRGVNAAEDGCVQR